MNDLRFLAIARPVAFLCISLRGRNQQDRDS